VRLNEKPELLRELTLCLLADLPDEAVRSMLKHWVEADRTDVDAQIAHWRRIAASPLASDPDRPTILAAIESLLSSHPDHIGARETLVAALADAGDPERGRALLDAWPEASRDARYWRLRGRWDLEYDQRPEQAVTAFQAALVSVPQDWRTWYRLARALRMLGRRDDSRKAAEAVSRIREILDPRTLGPRLDAAVNHLDHSASLKDLALLCDQAGLTRLADAWRTSVPVAAPQRTPNYSSQRLDIEDHRHGN
jgi:tetratricopeptide (TPR) repeat protein